MKLFGFLLCAAIGVSALHPRTTPYGAAISQPKKGGRPSKDKWGHCKEDWRHTVTIRSSKNDLDDISDDFLWGIKKANHGGTLHLQKGKKYVIGKKLDLSFLNDIYVKLDGEIKVRCSPPIVDSRASDTELYSSPTISPIGKRKIFITRSRSPSHFGYGAGKTSRYMAAARLTAMVRHGTMALLAGKFW
jgi:hypothetical protein